jgi:glycosyltransferase involved in cell wall biosynthesis
MPFDVVQACEWDAEAIVYSLRPSAPLVTRLATPHFLVQATNEAPWHQRWRSAFTSQMERVQSRRSRAVISPTRILAREVANRWHLDEDAIQVVPTGIDPPDLEPSPIPDFLGEAPYILYFGRLEIRKGVDVLIDALPTVLGANPDLHCVFIGEDLTYHGVPFPEYARERCAGYMQRIHFRPRMAHAPLFNIVANATVVAIPSRWENLANTCLESMVLGRAIVASSGSGFDEVLTDGVDGLLVTPGDVKALTSVLTGLLSDPREIERLGAAARRRAQNFTVDGMVARLMQVYDDVVA